jgi:heme o synthase
MPKSVALKPAADALLVQNDGVLTLRDRVGAYVALTKPRITVEVVMISAFGYLLATKGSFDWVKFFHAMFGIGLLSSGISALNQWIERDSDGLMRRTAARPLPAGKIGQFAALLFGLFLTAAALAYICPLVNPLSAILGALTAIGYVLCYTPLKSRTWLSTAIGSFPGAMPPLIGWAAATGDMPVGAWLLFGLMFFWQFPHFYAIAWMYREDYRRAGIKMLPVIEENGERTIRQTMVTAVITLALSVLPFSLGLCGWIYLAGAVALGVMFLQSCLKLAKTRGNLDAKRLLRVSVIYLPVLFLLMVLDKV